jgi:hypothetical protein
MCHWPCSFIVLLGVLEAGGFQGSTKEKNGLPCSHWRDRRERAEPQAQWAPRIAAYIREREELGAYRTLWFLSPRSPRKGRGCQWTCPSWLVVYAPCPPARARWHERGACMRFRTRGAEERAVWLMCPIKLLQTLPWQLLPVGLWVQIGSVSLPQGGVNRAREL